MYELLKDIALRPEPFSRYTVKELWTRPHLARQMLKYHLDTDTELASRRPGDIEEIVNWVDFHLDLPGRRLCDLGCGPGLYALRFTDCGAQVTGVDFSAHSLDYARRQASEQEMEITYLEADYLEDDLPGGFDIVTLIYTDYSALSPAQRSILLGRIREMLNPGGSLVLDVAGPGGFGAREEGTVIEKDLMAGFWAAGDYIGIQRTFVYKDLMLVLERYTIVEPGDTWEIFNWIQHFTPDTLRAELQAAGFRIEQMAGDLNGAPLEADSELIGVIAGID